MAQATLVEMNIQDGQRLIDRLIQDGVTVSGAAWVKESESGDWYLYLVTPLVGADGGKKSAYHRVNEVIRQMQQEGILTEVPEKKVVGPHDPIAKDMLAHRGGRPTRIPTRFEGARLGELAVDEAFLYPPPMKEQKV